MRILFGSLVKRIRKISLLLVLCAGLFFVAACAENAHDSGRLITLAESFDEDAQLSQQQQLPIVVFISQHGCEFCEVLREKVLFPMMRSGEMQEKAIFRELSLDKEFFALDFDGERISGMKFAERYGSVLTPTILFLGAGGRELARKRVGISNIEYYSFYFGQSLEQATSELIRSD